MKTRSTIAAANAERDAKIVKLIAYGLDQTTVAERLGVARSVIQRALAADRAKKAGAVI